MNPHPQTHNIRHTLCWDCHHATNPDRVCPWSACLQPVPGWTAIPTHNKDFESYIVTDCPLFERDAQNNGLSKIRKDKKK